jgi:hypothetical protein
MACLFRTLIAAAVLAGLSLPAMATDQWHRSTLTLPQALTAGFRVVDTYHNEQGHLFFVLQLDAQLLLCRFQEQQTETCVTLSPDR